MFSGSSRQKGKYGFEVSTRHDQANPSLAEKGKRRERRHAPTLSTLSARSSSAVAPCMTMTLHATSSHLYASANLWQANTLSRCVLVALIEAALPFSPLGGSIAARLAALSVERLNAVRPEDARIARSDASSTSRRILMMERNTPGSMGGGVGAWAFSLPVPRSFDRGIEGGRP